LKPLFGAIAAVALTVVVAAPLTGNALAQGQPAATPQHPQSKLVPRKGSPTPANTTAAAATTASGNAPDLAFGAFQRGQYITAFGVATERALDRKDPKSMTLLGELYANGLGVPQDDKKAAEWYELAAARGDPSAMFALAIFSLEGRAGLRDRQKSAQLMADAAKLGHPIAAYDLALLYIEGQLFPQDFNRAAELLRVAANAGNPQAQYALGTLYKEGRGVPKDLHEAVRLFSLAALADEADAQVEYAIALFNGQGVDRNQQLAVAYFHKAALSGNPIAQDRLANILANGLGVKANPVEAAKWRLISKAAGETDLALDEFINKLDPKTRSQAEDEARPWVDSIKRTLASNEHAPGAAPPK
jgi:TPR repeat protein